ncbi:MAG: hypothetical protein GXX96_34795 [Planctomycetaceae bacterium]|nr:hypothetical protein [Planctomycetaceae bacterium]
MRKLIGIGLAVSLIVFAVAGEAYARGGGGRGGNGGRQGMRGGMGSCPYAYNAQSGYGYGNQAAAMQQRMMQYRYGQMQGYARQNGMMQQQRLRDGSGLGQSARGGQAAGMQRQGMQGRQGGGMGAAGQQGGAGVRRQLRDGSCGIPVPVPQPESPF